MNSLNKKQSRGAGTNTLGTVGTDHIAGTMTGEKGSITKLEPRPKSCGECEAMRTAES